MIVRLSCGYTYLGPSDQGWIAWNTTNSSKRKLGFNNGWASLVGFSPLWVGLLATQPSPGFHFSEKELGFTDYASLGPPQY